jgi:hypothetical protein
VRRDGVFQPQNLPQPNQLRSRPFRDFDKVIGASQNPADGYNQQFREAVFNRLPLPRIA